MSFEDRKSSPKATFSRWFPLFRARARKPTHTHAAAQTHTTRTHRRISTNTAGTLCSIQQQQNTDSHHNNGGHFFAFPLRTNHFCSRLSKRLPFQFCQRTHTPTSRLNLRFSFRLVCQRGYAISPQSVLLCSWSRS